MAYFYARVNGEGAAEFLLKTHEKRNALLVDDSYRLRITDYGLQITDYRLRITDYGLRITHAPSRFTHHVSRLKSQVFKNLALLTRIHLCQTNLPVHFTLPRLGLGLG
jgi:hypothetical protein